MDNVFSWNFKQPANVNGQAAFDAYNQALQNKRNSLYDQNMEDRVVGNANDMASWMQEGNDSTMYQQQQQQLQQQQAAVAAQAKEKKIADIKSQIATLETRIAENQGKLKNWTGNAAEIAAIEARKVNSSDPTSIWRWKVDRDEARKIANAEKEKGNELAKLNAQIEIDNDLASMIVDNKMTSNDEKVFLSKLSTLRTLAQKSGLPTDKIHAKIREVKGEDKTVAAANSPEGSKFEGKPREQWTAEANDLLGNKKAKSKDIQDFLDQAGDNLDNDTRIKLNSAYRDLAKKEAEKADADAMHAYSEELGFGKWDLLSDRMKETVKRMWKTKKGKK